MLQHHELFHNNVTRHKELLCQPTFKVLLLKSPLVMVFDKNVKVEVL